MNYINELFSKHEIRKNKKQKTNFINWVKKIAEKDNWQVEIEKGMLGTRNIIIGNPDEAEIIFTAHYDTCANLPIPNFITPKNFFIYIIYQLLLTLLLLIPTFLASIIVFDIGYIILMALLLLMMIGPANKHTANDNTSGVATLLGLMDKFDGKKDKVALIFFDFEEIGLVGSSSYSSKHKNITKEKLLINFDCVSDGTTMLFVLNKNTKDLENTFKDSYESNKLIKSDVVTKGVFYPSDQTCFKKGIGVCAMNHNKFFKSGYIDKIHTTKDTVFKKENIEFLIDGSYKLYKNLTK